MGTEHRVRVALAGLLFATLFTFEQLFAHADYFGPALLAALVGGGIAVGGRRLGAGTPVTVGVAGAALLWYLALVFEGANTFYGLPTPAAAAGLARAVVRAAQLSNADFAPIPSRPGYVILVVTGMFLAALVGEIATFRWRRPLLATLPSLCLFAYALIVGEGAGTTLMLLLWLMLLLTYLALEASHRLASWGRFISTWRDRMAEPDGVSGALARRMGASCVAAALVAPILLPALQDGLLSWRSGIGGDGSSGGALASGRIDLLVELVPRALRQSDLELFEVEADRPSYWRLVSLSEFDGESWHPADRLRVPSDVGLNDEPRPTEAPLTRFSQRYRLTGLEGQYLPAAVTPVSVSFLGDAPEGASVLVDPETLDLRFYQGIQSDLTYEVESVVPQLSYQRLNAAEASALGPLYTTTPKLAGAVERLRDAWIEGADTDFEALVAIQEQLRGPSFEYSTDVQNSASTDYLSRFLLETRAGYCQQFATAFALLSRSLGYPTRVSVGFLPGSDSERSGNFVVRGTDAHAWPEVHFDGFGWVAFDPTPRTSAPAPGYTSAPVNLGSLRGAGGAANPEPAAPLGFPKQAERGETINPVPRFGPSPSARRPPVWREAFAGLIQAAALVLLVVAAALPLLKEWRLRARYRRARDPSGVIAAAFEHVADEAAELITLPRPSSESAASYARRLVDSRRAPAEIVELAHLFERSQYGADPASDAEAELGRRLATTLRSNLWSAASWPERARRLFAPPPLPAPLAGPSRRQGSDRAA